MQLSDPVALIEKTRIYPLGKQASAKAMQFPDASGVAVDMLYPRDGSYFDMLARFIENEYVTTSDLDMRGMLTTIGIIKGKPFAPDAHVREILDAAGVTAFKMSRVVAFELGPTQPGALIYPDRHWVEGFIGGSPEFKADSYRHLDTRTGFFAVAYSASPAMAIAMPGKGSKYPNAAHDSEGKYLSGEQSYRLHLPPNVPAANFWSVTVYDALTASGLDNGQPFPIPELV